MRTPISFLVLALSACVGTSPSDDTGTSDTAASDTGTDTNDGVDADGDGYGSDVDCDDSRSDVHPGATEHCTDGVDNNCDSKVDNCGFFGEADTSGAQYALYGPNRSYFGTSVTTGDFSGDGVMELAVAASGSDGLALNGVYHFEQPLQARMEPSAPEIGWAEPRGSTLRLLNVGDMNADGREDLLIWDKSGQGSDSAVYLVHGPLPTGTPEDVAHVIVRNVCHRPSAPLGDQNGDGFDDVLLGCGSNILIYGPSQPGDFAASTYPDAPVLNVGASQRAAGSADVDGDGRPDILVEHEERSVAIYTHEIQVSEAIDSADMILSTVKSTWDTSAIVDLGDVDGDGTDDFAITSSSIDDLAGNIAVWVDAPTEGADLYWDAEALLIGPEPTARIGELVSAGDVNGDSLPDIVAASAQVSANGSHSGAVYVVLAPVSGRNDIDQIAVAELQGEAEEYYFGRLAPLADLDGNGSLDIIAGAVGVDERGTYSGAVYIFASDL